MQELHSVHLNLAGGNLISPDYQKKPKQTIETFDFLRQRLELEIIETSAVGNLTQASEFIIYCRSKGIAYKFIRDQFLPV